MKVLLIEANDVARWVGGRAGGPNVHVVPIALVGLATWLEQRVPGTEVRVAESSLDIPSDAQFLRLLEEFQPDLVGLRAINFFRDEVQRLVRVAEGWGKAQVVVGGPMVTAMGATVFEWIPELQMAATGEGEHTLAALVEGAPKESIPGLWLRAPLGPRKAADAVSLESLDILPIPDYSKIDLERYSGLLSYAYNQRRQGVLVTSRGCPFKCTYCFQPNGSRVRLRSAEEVVREIEMSMERHGIFDFYVVDDIFNVNRKRALAVFDSLIERKLGVRIYFVNGLRVDLCDEYFLERMLKAGTVWVTYAIETAHPRVARLIRKELDLVKAHRVISETQKSGIVVNINTMFGFPTETPEEAAVTLDFIGSLPRPSLLPYHFNLRGYHGCEIVEQAEAAGWDREAFLASGFRSYNELPSGSSTFPRAEMIQHLLEYHRRFGLSSREHLAWSAGVLRSISYSDKEIVDMYSVLLNRRVASVEDLVPT